MADSTAAAAAPAPAVKGLPGVFTFGKDLNGSLGRTADSDPLSHYLPGRVAIKGQVVSIASGGLCSSAITSDGKLYVWGAGGHGRLGTGSEEDVMTPVVVGGLLAKESVVQIAMGDWHSVDLCASGRVFAFGNNTHGELGTGNRVTSLSPVEITVLRPLGITCVSAGRAFSAAIDAVGVLYTWGSNANGKLGLGSDVRDMLFPAPVSLPESAHSVHCGYEHAACCLVDGRLFTWGRGTDGALGIGSKKDRCTPQHVSTLSGVRVISVSCTRGQKYTSTAALTDDGEVWTWGAGYKGKLGHASEWTHADPADEPLPKKVAALAGHTRVLGITNGGIHMACWCDDGRVYTWGCGSDGRMGHPESADHRYLFREGYPRAVDGIPGRVRQVSCSYYHTVVLSE